MGQQVNVYRELKFFPGAIISGMPGQGEGIAYYVNNITGTTTADGLSWNSAVSTISRAVTLSEAHRDIQESDNQYIRNTILIQGTATAYVELANPGEHINFIGLGDNMMGHVAGIARIGADTGASTGGLVCTADMRGDYFYNLQFQGGGGDYAVYLTYAYRSTFEYCGFFTNGAAVTQPAVGFYINNKAGGLHLKDCHWGNAMGSGGVAVVGFETGGSCSHLHICLIEGCHITGSTAGVLINAVTLNTWGTVFRNNYIGEDSSVSGCTKAIDDNAASGGHIVFMNNYLSAGTAIELSSNGTTRNIGNMQATVFV